MDHQASLACTQPYSFESALAFFRARAIPGVEAVVDGHYQRTVAFDGRHGVIDVCASTRPGTLDVRLSGIAAARTADALRRVRSLLDVDAPVRKIVGVLRAEPALAARLDVLPGPRVIGAWDGFELLVRAILGQQVSVAAATTLSGRVASRYGTALDAGLRAAAPALRYLFPGPQRLARVHMNGMGIVGSRIRSIRALARLAAAGSLPLDGAADANEVYAMLTAVHGIGDWTAQYVLMRVLKQADAFPASDLGLMKAIEPGRRLSAAELRDRSDAWRPWRAYAAALLWQTAPVGGG